MPRASTIAQADIARVIRAVKECGYDCLIRVQNGAIEVEPFKPKDKALDSRKEFRL